jgi:hypothetical protein
MVARGAPAVETPGVLLDAGSVGLPVETTVVVTETSEETGVSEPEGTIRVVVPDAGGAVSEDGAETVGIGCPGGGKMTLVVVTTTFDSAGGGAAYELEAVGGISVTVTVTAGPQAQVAGGYVSCCKQSEDLQAAVYSHSMAATASASAATAKSLKPNMLIAGKWIDGDGEE